MAVGVHRVVFQHSRGTETSLAIVTHMAENSAKRAGSYPHQQRLQKIDQFLCITFRWNSQTSVREPQEQCMVECMVVLAGASHSKYQTY